MTAISTLGLTPERIRVWGFRSSVAILDQGLTSCSSLVLNLLLARWLPPETYGTFAVAFAGLLFASSFHNILLLEPMSVIGPARYDGQLRSYFRSSLKVHALVVGTLSVLFLSVGVAIGHYGSEQLARALPGVGIALPFLLLLWLSRRMCYVLQRPSAALFASIISLVVMSVGLIALHEQGLLTPFSAFVLTGAASLLASLLLLRQLGVVGRASRPEPPVPWAQVLRENWNYGRWLAASAVLFNAFTQTQTFLVAGFLGLGAAGILRAMQMPALVMTQIVTAMGLVVLPSMSYDIGLQRFQQLRIKASLTTLSLTSVALVYAALLFAVARPVEHVLYGGKYALYSGLIPLFALVPVCTGFATGHSMALRALQKPQFDLLSNAVAAPVGIISCILFIHLWGISGAVASMVLSFAAYALVFFWCYHVWTVSGARKASGPKPISAVLPV
jgi:O-antigen/teichoic acid export membrane protein